MSDPGFIAVAGLTKRYKSQAVVDGVSFDVAEGEFLTMLGPSGCGKTTTLRCIAGFIAPDGGSVRIGGRDMTSVPPHRRGLGMVFQNYALFPHLTVAENVAFGLRVRGMGSADVRARVERTLETVQLGGFGARYPKQLSGGQQQRVALARALAYEPRVLLLDEPLSNLDAKLRVEMRAEIRALQRQLGVTALYVTHDQEEALSVSDRVMVLNAGRIEQLSTPWDLYNRPQTRFVASFVGTSNILHAQRTAGGLRVADAVDLPARCDGESGEAWLVARPEGLTLGADSAGPSVPGQIKAVTMLGAMVRVEVALASGARVLVDLTHGGRAPAMSVGETVQVGFDPAAFAVITK